MESVTIGDLKLMTVEEFAKFSRSTIKTVYKRISIKEFPEEIYVKIGSRVYFIESRVAEWILNGAKLNRTKVKA